MLSPDANSLFGRVRRLASRMPGFSRKRNEYPSQADVSDIKQVWDQVASGGLKEFLTNRTWSAIPQTGTNQNRLITGSSSCSWKDYFKDTYFPDGRSITALSMGCGDGSFERELKERGLNFKSLTGIDISDACIEKAAFDARAVGLADEVNYFVADLNQVKLPENKFDLIFFFHSLHHVANLEYVLKTCRSALKDDGVFMANEYVGASRFQWTDGQIGYANEILNELPSELKFDHLLNKQKDCVVRINVEDLIAGDPSEAVRSGDIDALIKSIFTVVEEKNCGGTVTYLVFDGIASNFKPDHPEHSAIINAIIDKENALLDQNRIKSDFKFYVARK